MLALKIITCLLAIGVFYWARESEYHQTEKFILAVVIGVIYCVLLVVTTWGYYTIPHILIFISACLYVIFKESYEACWPFWIGMIITVVAYIIASKLYNDNMEWVTDTTTTKTTVICAKDNTSITGSLSGGIIYVQSSISQESVYQYYYQLEDGGIKQGTIPADSTTIYYTEGEAYLEQIVTTKYLVNYNCAPEKWISYTSDTVYKLYVPEGSVLNVYEFNAE